MDRLVKKRKVETGVFQKPIEAQIEKKLDRDFFK